MPSLLHFKGKSQIFQTMTIRNLFILLCGLQDARNLSYIIVKEHHNGLKKYRPSALSQRKARLDATKNLLWLYMFPLLGRGTYISSRIYFLLFSYITISPFNFNPYPYPPMRRSLVRVLSPCSLNRQTVALCDDGIATKKLKTSFSCDIRSQVGQRLVMRGSKMVKFGNFDHFFRFDPILTNFDQPVTKF